MGHKCLAELPYLKCLGIEVFQVQVFWILECVLNILTQQLKNQKLSESHSKSFGAGYGSVVDHLSSMVEALGSIPSTSKK
jgi:hypothetical protein